MIKHFFSLEFFKELKVLFLLESIILLLGYALINTPNVQQVIQQNNLSPFNLFALLLSLFIWSLSCLLDPKKYFNLATLIATGFITYLAFWFTFEIMFKVPNFALEANQIIGI
jgi:hypothetical protein